MNIGTKELFSSKPDLCWAYSLGLIRYAEALELQDKLLQARASGSVPDVLLLLQHPPVFTIGTSDGERNILVSRDTLAGEGIEVFRTDRGGSITYHGPGQLVGYPIFDLKTKSKDIHRYVRNLEEVVIRTLRDFSITAHRDSRYPGVWVGQEKICALGIRISRHWCTKHGFALNINNNLRHFAYIYPCGIMDRGVTSMSQLLGSKLRIEDVVPGILKYFSQVFDIVIQHKPPEQLGNYYAA